MLRNVTVTVNGGSVRAVSRGGQWRDDPVIGRADWKELDRLDTEPRCIVERRAVALMLALLRVD
jgi:hypothetical protein